MGGERWFVHTCFDQQGVRRPGMFGVSGHSYSETSLSALLNAYPEYYRGRAVSRVLHFIVEPWHSLSPLFSRERVQLCIYAESSDFYRCSHSPHPNSAHPSSYFTVYLPSLLLFSLLSPPSRCGSASVKETNGRLCLPFIVPIGIRPVRINGYGGRYGH